MKQRRTTKPADEAIWFAGGERGAEVGLLRARYEHQFFPRHSHDGFVFCVNERGAHASWYKGATVVIPERTITVVPPEEVHTGQPVPGVPWHYRAIYPGTDFLSALARDSGYTDGSTPTFRNLVTPDTGLADAFVRMHERCEVTTDALEREELVSELLLAILRRHASGARRARSAAATPPRRGIARTIEFIHARYTESLSLSDLGDAAGMSRFTVIRAFRRIVGLSPHAYVVQVRIENAKRLLASGASIARVATAVGFADQSHLNRHFKRLLGVTPATFARGAAGRRSTPVRLPAGERQ
jgi:AraC-like DNA-binding protein